MKKNYKKRIATFFTVLIFKTLAGTTTTQALSKPNPRLERIYPVIYKSKNKSNNNSNIYKSQNKTNSNSKLYYTLWATTIFLISCYYLESPAPSPEELFQAPALKPKIMLPPPFDMTYFKNQPSNLLKPTVCNSGENINFFDELKFPPPFDMTYFENQPSNLLNPTVYNSGEIEYSANIKVSASNPKIGLSQETLCNPNENTNLFDELGVIPNADFD